MYHLFQPVICFFFGIESLHLFTRCPTRSCHEAVKCEGHFIDSFKIAHLEDCIKACRDKSECNFYTLEKTHDHCLLYEDCEVKNPCDTCASGPRHCSVGYHDPTPCQTDADCPADAGDFLTCFGGDALKGISGFCYPKPWGIQRWF